MKEYINIFIGLDEAHPQAYDVCRESILRNNKRYKLSIQPINYNTVTDYYRAKDKTESTQFSFARFWTPWESNRAGVSIFVDSDFVFLESIDNLLDLYDDRYAVMCCKHEDYEPKGIVKMGDKPQSKYPRKNWSSLIIFNNSYLANDGLCPIFLNSYTGAHLHRFEWLEDNEIGALPVEWNWLVDYYTETKDFKHKALHYTDGGPWLEEYKNCSYSNIWKKIYNETISK
jgi:lipopolysaccharide biosynthesis glycosyltransferase